MIKQNEKGQWVVTVGDKWAKFPTEEEAKARLKSWGEEPEEEDLYEDDGQPDEAQEWHDFDPDA